MESYSQAAISIVVTATSMSSDDLILELGKVYSLLKQLEAGGSIEGGEVAAGITGPRFCDNVTRPGRVCLEFVPQVADVHSQYMRMFRVNTTPYLYEDLLVG